MHFALRARLWITRAPALQGHNPLDGHRGESESLAAQFQLNRRTWNALIESSSLAGGLSGVPGRKSPIFISLPADPVGKPKRFAPVRLTLSGDDVAMESLGYAPSAGRSSRTKFMNTIKLICLTIVELVKQVWRLPQTIALTLQQRRQQSTRHQFETERLDRIRNPSKYRGR